MAVGIRKTTGGNFCPVCLNFIENCTCKARATVPRLNVSIESLDHSDQRYDTCGDWYYGATSQNEGELYIKVSQLPSRREMFLVAIHELIEAFLCECAGVTEKQVDAFDLMFNDHKEGDWGEDMPIEPGDDTRAPYYHQHQIATGIERILAAEAQVDWLEYERHIQELSK